MLPIKAITASLRFHLSKILPDYLVNRYFITAMVFFIWMIFFDKNKWVNQWQLSQSIYRLEQEQKILAGMIVEARRDKEDLEKNKEKYAREKYYMHKENEDIFIFEENLNPDK
ncbi:MAG TPA: septum formation initiator family protein [Saprospiraceae bacterium]|nr:septum formation initiator family protein [Saprospiraceae bacterium]HNT21209.1 septum formation initiator family protein [Saprospiraceae bacterium]